MNFITLSERARSYLIDHPEANPEEVNIFLAQFGGKLASGAIRNIKATTRQTMELAERKGWRKPE